MEPSAERSLAMRFPEKQQKPLRKRALSDFEAVCNERPGPTSKPQTRANYDAVGEPESFSEEP